MVKMWNKFKQLGKIAVFLKERALKIDTFLQQKSLEMGTLFAKINL